MFGSAVTWGATSAELTRTLTVFEVTVSGIAELSVTFSLKLHAPTGVDVVGEKIKFDPFASAIGEKIPPSKASNH